MSTALLLIDFQQEWTDPNSDYYVGDLTSLIQKTNQLIDFARTKNFKIIFTRHVEPESEDAFAPNSKGVELLSELRILPSDVIITKHKISPFYKATLEKELKGIDHVIIAGILTNLCVRSAVQDAYDRDFEITVIEDCCVAMDKKIHQFTLEDLKNTREEIAITRIADFLKR